MIFKKLVYLIFFEIFMHDQFIYIISSILCPQLFLCLPTSFKIISFLLLSCDVCVLVWVYIYVCYIQIELFSIAWMYMY